MSWLSVDLFSQNHSLRNIIRAFNNMEADQA